MAVSDYWGLGNQDRVVFKKLSKPVTVCNDNLLQPLQLCSLAKAIGFQSSRIMQNTSKWNILFLCYALHFHHRSNEDKDMEITFVCFPVTLDTVTTSQAVHWVYVMAAFVTFQSEGGRRDLKVYMTPEAFLSKRQRRCCHPIWKSGQSPAHPTEKQRLRLRLTSRCLTDHLAAAPNGDRSTEFL